MLIDIEKLLSKSYPSINNMSQRTIPLLDPQHRSWSERMSPGEYAVHYSFQPVEEGTPANTKTPTCTVFSTLPEAEAHATAQVAQHPAMRCRIYTHEGLGYPPVREIVGPDFRDNSGLSASFRRWTGSILFFGSILLLLLDWYYDFNLGWPMVISIRAFPTGLILLLTELVILYAARRQAARP